MVWLLTSQGMKNCKSTESFFRSILAIYTNDWSTFWYVYCCCLFFFSGKFQNIYQPRTTLDLLSFDSLTHINWHFMQEAILNKLASDGECRLAPFHAIRNFLANENYHFSRLCHQTGCPFTWAACSI